MNISAIIPAHNNQVMVDECIPPIIAESSVTEVIVVDDGSENPIICCDARVIRIERPSIRRSRTAACNTGAAAANGEYLFFCDSNKVCQAGTVSVCASDLMDMEIALGKEVMVTVRHEGMTDKIIMDHGGGCFMRHASFLELGGYDAESFVMWGMDGYDFSLRWLMSGRRIYSPGRICSRRIADRLVHRDMARAEVDFQRKWGKPRSDVIEEAMR